MANLITGIISVFKFLFENPLWSIAIVFGILLMPLEVFDLILYLIVNLVVIIVNLIYWLLVLFVNILISVLNYGLDFIFSALSSLLGGGSTPQLTLFVYEQQPYVTVDLFSPDKNLLLIILEFTGRVLPLW